MTSFRSVCLMTRGCSVRAMKCYTWVSLLTFLNKQWTAGQCEVSIRKNLSCKCPDSFPDTCGMIYVHEWTSIFLHKRITCIKHTHTHLVQNHIRAHHISTSCTKWLVNPKNTCLPVVYVAGRCTPLDYVTSYPKKTLLLSLYCSVMHLFSKQFLGRFLRVYLSPGWKLLAGNIRSTIRCMYFCDQRNIYYQKYTFFQRKPTYASDTTEITTMGGKMAPRSSHTEASRR